MADIVAHAVRAQARAHPSAVLIAAATAVSVTCEILAVRAGLTANILWAPTNLMRALALMGTTLPWVAVIVLVRGRRRAAGRA